jgi:O-antigen ligase
MPLLALPLVLLLGYLAATSPVDALALAALVTITIALLSDLVVGVCIFVGAQAALPIIPVDALPKFLGLALLARWLIDMAVPNPARPLKSFARQYPAIAVVVIGSLVWSLMTLLWAPDPGETLNIVSRYALNVILFMTIFAASRDQKAMRWLSVAIAISGALTVIMLFVTGTRLDTTRLSDAAVDANDLAMGLLVSILFGGLLLIQSKNGLHRLFYAGLVAVDFYGLQVTNSRGGLVALVVAMVAWVIVGGRWRTMLALAAVIALTSGIAYTAILAPAEQRDRIYVVLGIGSKPVDRSGTGRTDIWTVGLRAFRDRPIEGFGYANYRQVVPHYLLSDPGLIRRSKFILSPLVAHNTYLQALVEVGIIGAMLFFLPVIGALVAFLLAARRFQRSGDDEMELLARTGFAALIGVLVASFFISEGLSKILWILMGMGYGLYVLNQSRPPRKRLS